MLRDYPGKVTVRIASIAASAASVVAMSGNPVQMSPTALIMIHDPSTIAMGNAKDMEKAITTLNEVKESIINAYAFKTGLTRNRISKLMSDETWLNAKKAVELGFADEILFESKKKAEEDPDEKEPDQVMEEAPNEEEKSGEEKEKPRTLEDTIWQFSSRLMGETILNRLGAKCESPGKDTEPESTGETLEPPEAGLTKATVEERPDMPMIGMDGKTKDGAMPYEILKEKLEWLK